MPVPRTSLAYRALTALATAALPLAAPWHRKLGRGHRGRRGSADRLTAWAGRHRDPARRLVWFHAPSVGEGLQAESVVRALRARQPDWQVVFTHFSPSAEAVAARMPADVTDYLPPDRPAACRAVLEGLAPDGVIFVKLDLWPELATRAARAGHRVGLVAGTVSPLSGRTRWPIRTLLRPGYAAVSAAGAIAAEDAERLVGLGVARERIEVLGDPRFDSVIERLDGTAGAPLPLAPRNATLVAGSTWPADEAVLLDAFAATRARRPDARLILAPHEPGPARLDAVERAVRTRGLPPPVRLSARASEDWTILVVDSVGLLARLYGSGGVAYVGGGFGRAGLHSVLEPAAWGRPVVFGPRWQGSRDAALLRAAEAGVALPRSPQAAAGTLAGRWLGWLDAEETRRAAGRRAREVVERGRGAAERNARLVERLVLEG